MENNKKSSLNFTINQYNLGNYHIPSDSKGGTCIEIGANVGSFFSKHSNHFSVIHYYEPVKECFDICKKKSDKLNNVTGWNLAGYHTSNLQINLINHKQRMAGSIAVEDLNNGDWLKDEIVATPYTISLEDIVNQFESKSIDYIKLDCENSEYHILLNKDLTPFKYIAIELHWQMGEDKWYQLLNHIKLTHNLVYGDSKWSVEQNKDLFFQRK